MAVSERGELVGVVINCVTEREVSKIIKFIITHKYFSSNTKV